MRQKKKPDEFNNFQIALVVVASLFPLIALIVVLLGYWLGLRWLAYVGIVIHLFFVLPGLLYIHVKDKSPTQYRTTNQQVTLLVITTTTALLIMAYGSGIWVFAGVTGWCVAWWTLFYSRPGRVKVVVSSVVTCPNCGAQLDPGVLANYASIAVGSIKCGGCGHSFSADALRK